MTTPRSHARTRRAAAILVVVMAGMFSLPGCDPRQLMYFLQPNELTIPAPGPSLKGKRVVVVAHAVSTAQGAGIDHDLVAEFVSILRKKVTKIEVINPDKVWAWMEAHPKWTDQEEIAKAFEADMVIFIEIEGFQVQGAGDLNVFNGTAKCHVIATEIDHRIRLAMQSLSGRQKAVFALKHYSDHSLDEIAGILDLDLATVKTHMARALEKLRGELKDLYGRQSF